MILVFRPVRTKLRHNEILSEQKYKIQTLIMLPFSVNEKSDADDCRSDDTLTQPHLHVVFAYHCHLQQKNHNHKFRFDRQFLRMKI